MKLLDSCNDVLLYILSFLDTKDLLAVSKTCTRLHELCVSTSSIWRSYTVKLGRYKQEHQSHLTLAEEEKEVLENNGHGIQNMHMRLHLGGKQFHRQSLEFLCQVSRLWNLKTFHFDAFFGRNGMCKNIMEMLRNCLTSTDVGNRGLHTLSLSADRWSAYTDNDEDISSLPLLKVLRSAPLGDGLKHFSLDCCFSDLKTYVWTDNKYVVCKYGKVIGKFKNLQKLDINSLYLTDSLMEALCQSGNVSLQSLTLVVCYLHNNITAWPTLLRSFPSLKVMIEVEDTVVDVYVERFRRNLPAIVPVVSWKTYCFHQFGGCLKHDHQQEVIELLGSYSGTLQSFAFQSFSICFCHSAFLEMVTKCSKLQSLHVQYLKVDVQGPIRSDTILEIASLPRAWLKLGFLTNNITFPASWMGSQREKIARLCVEVSEKLGYDWKPEENRFEEKVFSLPKTF